MRLTLIAGAFCVLTSGLHGQTVEDIKRRAVEPYYEPHVVQDLKREAESAARELKVAEAELQQKANDPAAAEELKRRIEDLRERIKRYESIPNDEAAHKAEIHETLIWVTPADQRLDAEQHEPLAFEGIPVSDALAALSKQLKINICPDWPSLKADGVDPAGPITLKLDRYKLGDALQQLLQQAGGKDIAIGAVQNVVMCTTPQSLEKFRAADAEFEKRVESSSPEQAKRLRDRFYSIPIEFSDVPVLEAMQFFKDLSGVNVVTFGLSADATVSCNLKGVQFGQLLTLTLAQLPAQPAFTWSVVDDVFVVEPAEHQARLSRLLEQTRNAAQAHAAADGTLPEKLRPLRMAFPELRFEQVPLGDALGFITSVTQMPIELDEAALQPLGVTGQTPLTLELRNVSTDTILVLIINQLPASKPLTLRIEADRVVLTAAR